MRWNKKTEALCTSRSRSKFADPNHTERNGRLIDRTQGLDRDRLEIINIIIIKQTSTSQYFSWQCGIFISPDVLWRLKFVKFPLQPEFQPQPRLGAHDSPAGHPSPFHTPRRLRLLFSTFLFFNNPGYATAVRRKTFSNFYGCFVHARMSEFDWSCIVDNVYISIRMQSDNNFLTHRFQLSHRN